MELTVLPRRDLWRVLGRSFFLPALWTVQRGQNLGFLFSLWPVFRRLYPRRDDRARALQAHAGFFSTHPYTAGVLLGVVSGLEEERVVSALHPPIPDQTVTDRTSMAGPLAALGESFFWATCLPLVLAFCLFWAFLLPQQMVWVPVFFVLVFNGLHVGVRAIGLGLGYRLKLNVVSFLTGLRIHRGLMVMSVVGVGLCLLASSLWGWFNFLLTLVFFLLMRWGLPPLVLALVWVVTYSLWWVIL